MINLVLDESYYEEPKVVAEIGCNHMGDFEIAKEMVKIAKIYCNADVVKFQKRNPKELLTPEEYNSPHPNPIHSFGKTYGEHREFLEFTIEQHYQLKEYAEKELGIIYSTSIWDMTSARQIVELNPKLIKIPSACSTYWEMHDYLCKNYNGEIHISTGMTTRDEVEQIVQFYEEKGKAKNVVLYHCTSGYPVPFEDTMLLEIARFKEKYGKRVKAIGFSGHHKGIAIDIAAYTLGAKWIERHFTLDRTWKGTDQAASLEPDGLRKLKRDLLATYKSLKFKPEGLLEIEKTQAKKLRWDRHNKDW
ncbi:MAG: sialic acid synthase [Thermosipho sp. (in: thermotogales)]|jgi:N-acetylneuraminate synthase|nr:sialic acid synthase [Thermosipho sp. (in: thermotogales)]MDN5325256.1 sialic acid synthase [Thermosipho sp. (in: thermotogales)]